jgi:alkyl sulfatase BDS1-like metallo-beta-lactamase superfamily hydrolase
MRFGKHLLFTAVAIPSLFAFATLASAQQQASPLKVTKIKDNIYWVQGGVGSNDGIIVGKTGVIVVDTKTTPDSEKEVIAEIAKITPEAVKRAQSYGVRV